MTCTIQEISATATKLTNSGHPDCKQIKSRDEMLSRELKHLQNLSKVRRDRLVEVSLTSRDHVRVSLTVCLLGNTGPRVQEGERGVQGLDW